MTSCIRVNSHKDIILMMTYFDCSIKISTLETSIKDGTISIFKRWIHSLERATMFRFEVRVKFSEVGSKVWEIGIN